MKRHKRQGVLLLLLLLCAASAVAQPFRINHERIAIEGLPRYLESETGCCIYANDFSIIPGDTLTVPVYLSTSVSIYTLQVDLVLPDSLAVSDVCLSDTLLGSAFATGYSLVHGPVSTGYRILLYNPSSQSPIPPCAGFHLLDLTVTAADSLAPDQELPLEFREFIFVGSDDKIGYKGLDTSCTVTVESPTPSDLPRLSAPELTLELADTGNVVALPLTLTMPKGGSFTNIQLHLTYPAGVKPARVNYDKMGNYVLDYDSEDGWWHEPGDGIARIGRYKVPCVNFFDNFEAGNGPSYIVIGTNMTQTPNTDNPNHVLTVYVTVDSAALTAGDRDMLAYVKYTDTSNHSYEFGDWKQYKPFTTLHFSRNLRGDVNGDGVVDVDDLNIVINIMIRKATLERWPAADLDGTGVVDVDDLNHVINIMIRKE